MADYRQLNWRLVLAVWTGLGFLLILQSYISYAANGEVIVYHVTTWVAQMYRAWFWAAWTPLVFWLKRELPRRHRSWLVIGALHALAAMTLFAVGNVLRIWALWLTLGYWDFEHYRLSEVYNILGAYSIIDFYIYWAVLLIAHMLDVSWNRRQAELRAEQLRTLLSEAELAALKQQVHPHFLFNSLNAVASLIREGHTERSVEALARLSSLLRQLMNYAGRPGIELWRELDYAQSYLSVEQVRLEERLITHFDADEECLGALVPTLLLQPLVENAIKHGIAQRRNPGRVSVTAHRHGEWLRLRVSNDPAEGGRRSGETESHGIGLSSTRTRLQRTFGEKHRLECSFNGPDGTVVTIEIPLRYAEGSKPTRGSDE